MGFNSLGSEMPDAAVPTPALEAEPDVHAPGVPTADTEAAAGAIAEAVPVTEAPTPGVIAGIRKFVRERWKQSKQNSFRYAETQARRQEEQAAMLGWGLSKPML